jgi:hypothetical protein
MALIGPGWPAMMVEGDTAITIVTPPEELTVGRNPVTVKGTVSDPSIGTVYAVRVGAPVLILGRRHDELPGVPFPVVDGKFTATVVMLAEGENVIRITGIDGAGQVHVAEVRASLFEALDRPPNVEIELVLNKRRYPTDGKMKLYRIFTNNTLMPFRGTYDLSMKLPDGTMIALAAATAFQLAGGRTETQSMDVALAQLSPEPGYCGVIGEVKDADGNVISQDTIYFETYLPGDFSFTDITQAAGVNHHHRGGVFAAGAGFGDYNNDGRLDLYASDRGGNYFYRNNGDGTFTDVTVRSGATGEGRFCRAVAWGDYNNDGFRDLFLSTKNARDFLYRNNGNGTFTNVAAQAGVGGSGTDESANATWGDYNHDGWLDLYVGNDSGGPVGPGFVGAPGQPNYLYRNNGDGTFTEVGKAYGVNNWGRTLAAQWTDYDNDGDVDLVVINDFGQVNDYPNTLYRNDGADDRGGWIFTEVGPTVGFYSRLFGMGVGGGDVDNDGDLDYYISNCGIGAFHKNNGDGTFTEATFESGLDTGVPSVGPYAGTDAVLCTWGVTPWDFDLDGWVDYYVTAGQIGGSGNFPVAGTQLNLLFHNQQDGSFTEAGHQFGLDYPGETRGAAFGDIDNDGDLDLFLANTGEEGVLFRNDLRTGHHWLGIRLVGTVSNRDGFGAKIFVTTGQLRQMREVPGGDPHLSSNSLEQVFGLGQNTRVDRIEVRWPSGRVQVLENVAADRKIVIEER